MSESERSGWVMPFSIIVSAFGLFTILALAAYNAGPTETVAWRKPVVGSIFALICILGIVLTLSPRKCSETFGHKKRLETATFFLNASNSVLGTKGHHYDCGKFSAHTIQVNGHVLCAACTGLFLGALGALFGNAIFFFVGWDSWQIGFLAVVLGVAATTLGFLQFKFGGLARLILNVLFVLGAFLILAGMDGLIESLSVDLFSIALIAFWIFTRILISQWNHLKICRRCPIICEIRGSRKVGSISSAQSVQGTDHD
jgi:hypothetical protein